MKRVFAVDIPNPNDPEDAWVNIDFFDTREEALEYCMTTFGADEHGRIDLISEISGEEEPEEET